MINEHYSTVHSVLTLCWYVTTQKLQQFDKCRPHWWCVWQYASKIVQNFCEIWQVDLQI